MKSLVWQQNPRQKVYRGGCTFVEWGVGLYTGRLYICAVGLDILKLE